MATSVGATSRRISGSSVLDQGAFANGCRHSERAHLSSGRQTHEAIDTPIGKVGILICWDIACPEAFRELITQGAKIIIVPCFWGLKDCSEEGLRYNPGSEALF